MKSRASAAGRNSTPGREVDNRDPATELTPRCANSPNEVASRFMSARSADDGNRRMPTPAEIARLVVDDNLTVREARDRLASTAVTQLAPGQAPHS